MFVRIKKRALRNGPRIGADYSLRLVVVESYRSDGVPRQRIVKYLGSIRRSTLKDSLRRTHFIAQMQQKLDRLDLDLAYSEVVNLKLSLIRALHHL